MASEAKAKGLLTKRLYNLYVSNGGCLIDRQKIMTFIVGGDMDKDLDDILAGKAEAFNQPRNIFYFESFERINKMLPPAKLDLLRFLMKEQSEKKPVSVSETAKRLDRHQEAISRDINHLKNLGFIKTKKVKQAVYAFPVYSAIEIKMAQKASVRTKKN
jgi:predicted transcriptional regulator